MRSLDLYMLFSIAITLTFLYLTFPLLIQFLSFRSILGVQSHLHFLTAAILFFIISFLCTHFHRFPLLTPPYLFPYRTISSHLIPPLVYSTPSLPLPCLTLPYPFYLVLIPIPSSLLISPTPSHLIHSPCEPQPVPSPSPLLICPPCPVPSNSIPSPKQTQLVPSHSTPLPSAPSLLHFPRGGHASEASECRTRLHRKERECH